uniref:Uncharacterized protein n=1 Tax=Zea mays TaxID=4577 RepID=A0A804MJE3_MAIZE
MSSKSGFDDGVTDSGSRRSSAHIADSPTPFGQGTTTSHGGRTPGGHQLTSPTPPHHLARAPRHPTAAAPTRAPIRAPCDLPEESIEHGRRPAHDFGRRTPHLDDVRRRRGHRSSFRPAGSPAPEISVFAPNGHIGEQT